VRALARSLLLLAVAAQAALAAHHSTIHVTVPWSRAMPPVARNGAVYMAVVNAGASADRIVAVESPIAARAELHAHTVQDGVMKMTRVPEVPLPAGARAVFAPGGLHVMLMDLREPLEPGRTFPLTLRFEHADPLVVEVTVHRGAPEGAAMGGHGDGAVMHE